MVEGSASVAYLIAIWHVREEMECFNFRDVAVMIH